ncbi:MAG: hypothetical protein IPL08_18020 [Saprospiraceae bacterium]|nr:hypothetical protein [Saprospiraceae bacterium]
MPLNQAKTDCTGAGARMSENEEEIESYPTGRYCPSGFHYCFGEGAGTYSDGKLYPDPTREVPYSK